MRAAGRLLTSLARRYWLYGACVVLPFLLLAFYFAAIRSDGYVSRAQLVVERDAQGAVPGLELGLLDLSGGSSKVDALLIRTFIGSRAMLDHLQATLDLRAHYQSRDVDFGSRLREQDSEEDFYEYFSDHVKASVDSESSVITLEVVAYTPAFAQQVAEAIVRRSEEFVNEVGRQGAREQLAFVQSEVDQASRRMRAAADALIRLQREYQVFSPEAESETSSRIVSELQAELAKQKTEIKALQAYLNPSAPEVIAAQKRISAIEQQLLQERRRQVGDKGEGVNDLMLRYQAAQLDVQLTGDLYQASLKSLEMTRLDASRKAKYVVRVSPPSLPDEAELPHIGRVVVALLVFLNLGYFVLTLIIATIKDHTD